MLFHELNFYCPEENRSIENRDILNRVQTDGYNIHIHQSTTVELFYENQNNM